MGMDEGVAFTTGKEEGEKEGSEQVEKQRI
jgi:hypothetical protein